MVLILLLGINNQTEGFGDEAMVKPVKDHVLNIIKIDGEWKVVLADDHKKTKVKAKKNEKITWIAKGTDVYFQFMNWELFKKFKAKTKDSLLTLKVSADADTGTYKYAVFCLADSQFATGGSPPEIDITD